MAAVIEKIEDNPLDRIIASETTFSLSLQEQEDLSRELCAQYFLSMQRDHPLYGRYAAAHARTAPPDLHLPSTFPSLPSSAFKRGQALAVPGADIAKWCASSGTTGQSSKVGRSRTSIERLFSSVRTGLQLVADWNEDDIEIVHLGPDYAQAGDIWFSYVTSLTELLFPTTSYATAGVIDYPAALAHLTRLLREGKRAGVLGAPFAVLSLARLASERRVPLAAGEDLTVVTSGGWKRHGGSRIDPVPFRAEVARAFGLDDTAQIRDAFNQVELNTVFVECAAHQKHVPPWVWPFARDPRTLQPLPDGQPGLLSYVDASADSYPCLMVSDDLGVVRRGRCGCGRDAVTLEFIRRIDRDAQRGCAIGLDVKFRSQ